MARKTTKVEIPKNADELLILLGNVLKKDNEDGINSPLKTLKMGVLQVKTDETKSGQEESKRLQRLAEIETAKRDSAIGTAQTSESALYILTQIRDLLLTIYKDNPKRLGEWGFTVIEGEVTNSKPTPPAKNV